MTDATDVAFARRPSRAWLWAEFVLLYVAGPLALLIFFEYLSLFASIAAIMLLGLLLLIRTPEFRWLELVDTTGLHEHWRMVLWVSLAMTASIFALAWLLLDEAWFLRLVYERPMLLPLIWLLYPWFSVLGQEVVFRPLFFKRYGELFPNETAAILVNSAVFAFAHAFYWNITTLVISFFGGVIFAVAYRRTGNSFPVVFILHWIAGGMIFTSGMGRYFYQGAIGQ